MTRTGCALIVLVLAPGFASARGQDSSSPSDTSFDESQRLTAVDLVVGWDQNGFSDWATDPAPLFPDPGDFELLVDGLRHPVLSVGVDEPWEVVLFFQTERSRTAHLQRSALELADHAEALATLGPITVVVADPRPVVILSQESHAQALRSTLGELSASFAGEDVLVGMRDEVRQELQLIEAGSGATGMLAPELVSAALAEEIRTVREGNDRMVLWLAEHSASRAQKLVVLVDGGYDARPADAWQDVASPEGQPSLEAETQALEHLLASYGWTVLGLHPQPEEPLRTGWTIGKWRFHRYEGQHQKIWDPLEGREVDSTFLGWTFRRESQRKPKRAEAYLDLGSVHLESGEPEKAADSLRLALYHFAGHAKTADRQAVALLHLGEALRQLGDAQEARVAFRMSRALDADSAQRHLGSSPDLRDPLSSLQRLLTATGGRLAAGRGEVGAVLEELRHRVRITYQRTGVPDGRIFPVEVALSGPWRDPVHPLWARHSTPEQLTEARLRLAATEELLDGPLGLAVQRRTDGRVDIRVDPTALAVHATGDRAGDIPALFRVSIASVSDSDGQVLEIHHRLGDLVPLSPREPWTTTVDAPPDAPLTLLVEDLLTGSWGASTLVEQIVGR